MLQKGRGNVEMLTKIEAEYLNQFKIDGATTADAVRVCVWNADKDPGLLPGYAVPWDDQRLFIDYAPPDLYLVGGAGNLVVRHSQSGSALVTPLDRRKAPSSKEDGHYAPMWQGMSGRDDESFEMVMKREHREEVRVALRTNFKGLTPFHTPWQELLPPDDYFEPIGTMQARTTLEGVVRSLEGTYEFDYFCRLDAQKTCVYVGQWDLRDFDAEALVIEWCDKMDGGYTPETTGKAEDSFVRAEPDVLDICNSSYLFGRYTGQGFVPLLANLEAPRFHPIVAQFFTKVQTCI